jgi:hypothetical protein
MFREMGVLDPSFYEGLVAASREYFALAIPAGRYLGWVREPVAEPGTIVGGAGVQLRELAPRPDPSGRRFAAGPEAYILKPAKQAYYAPEAVGGSRGVRSSLGAGGRSQHEGRLAP